MAAEKPILLPIQFPYSDANVYIYSIVRAFFCHHFIQQKQPFYSCRLESLVEAFEKPSEKPVYLTFIKYSGQSQGLLLSQSLAVSLTMSQITDISYTLCLYSNPSMYRTRSFITRGIRRFWHFVMKSAHSLHYIPKIVLKHKAFVLKTCWNLHWFHWSHLIIGYVFQKSEVTDCVLS